MHDKNEIFTIIFNGNQRSKTLLYTLKVRIIAKL